MTSFEPSWKKTAPRGASPEPTGSAGDYGDRVEVARVVLLGVMGGTALLFAVLALVFGTAGGLELLAAFALVFGVPAAVAALVVARGEGGERGTLAVIVAWGIALGLPVIATFVDGMGWSSGPIRRDWMLLRYSLPIAAAQVLVPAAVRWARRGGRFLASFAIMIAILIVAQMAIGRVLFPGLE